MTAFLLKAVSIILAISIFLGSAFYINDRIIPHFDKTPVREKIEYDEGNFVMKNFDVVVATNGDDNNLGTVDSPLKTIEAAKDKIKALKDADCGTVTVWLREGTYYFDSALDFNSDDLTDVVYRSYPNETVVFSGAKEYLDWKETTVNGVSAFVTDVDINSDADYFNALYNGEKRLARASFSKSGDLYIESAKKEDSANPDSDYFQFHNAFYVNTKDIAQYKNIEDINVRIMHFWKDELLPVSSIDTTTGRIEVSKVASMTIKAGDRYILENVFEALTQPGEWYLDKSEKKLYYIPMDGETISNTVLKAALTEQLITMNNCSNISFEGIDFKDTAWRIISGENFADSFNLDSPILKNSKYKPDFPQASYDVSACIDIENSNNISFVHCIFREIGSTALMFGLRTNDCKAESCLFDDIGANAVFIKGNNDVNDESQQTKNISVNDCHIKNYGQVFNNAIGVLLIHAKDCEISHNEIHDGFYSGISAGWMWGYAENVTNNIQIKDNLIYNIGLGWLSDMGGIYTLGVQPDTVISGNTVHDVGCYSGGGGYGGWGIYLDEGSSYMTVEKNLVYKCSSQGFHQHYGENNMIRNNIFALNGEAQICVSKKEDHNSLYLYKNIIVSDNSPIYLTFVKDNFKDSGNIYWDYTRKCNVLSGTGTSIKKRKYIIEIMAKGYYKDAKFADPMFKDAKNSDFTLAKNSPAIKNGFETWDYSQAGTLTKFN